MEFLNSQNKPPPDGDYVVFRSTDTQETRNDACLSLAQQGCRRMRYVTLGDGRLQAHGYLREVA